MLLKYDGPALTSHRMDVRDLAPALLGLADAVQSAGQIIDPNVEMKLDVTATQEGSFEILMLLDFEPMVSLFAGLGATALANGLSIGGAVKSTILGAIRIVKMIASNGGMPERVATVKPINPNLEITLRFPNGGTMEASLPSWEMVKDPKAMAGLAKMAEPLKEGAIDSLSLTDGKDVAVVDHTEKHAFVRDVEPDILMDETGQMILEIIDVNFRESKWRVSDGDAEFSVLIADDKFLAQVKDRKFSFSDGDSIRAEVRTVQRMVNVRPRTERTVLHVYEFIEGTEQPDLFGLDLS